MLPKDSLPDASPPPPTPESFQPRSKTELFVAFNSVALQGFGGVLTIIQREIVDRRRWLTPQQFVEDWAVAQVLPGGNVINLSIILGNRYFGWRGALVALAGLMATPLLIVLALATLYTQFEHVQAVSGAVRGMGAAAAGLIGAAAIKMVSGLQKNILRPLVCTALIVLTFIAVGLFRVPLIYTVLGLGIPGFAYAWAMVRKEEQSAAHSDRSGA
ncbi:MAG: chromate transporter [Burkholderiaceae bacterium]